MKAIFKQIDGEERLTGLITDNSSTDSKEVVTQDISKSELQQKFEKNGLDYSKDFDGLTNLKFFLKDGEIVFDESYEPDTATGGS